MSSNLVIDVVISALFIGFIIAIVAAVPISKSNAGSNTHPSCTSTGMDFNVQWNFSPDLISAGHDGPRGFYQWGDASSSCNGSRQSPINIETAKTIRISRASLPMNLSTAAMGKLEGRLSNTGYYIDVEVTSEQYWTPPGMKDVFRVHSLHFHWGSHDSFGSEHHYDGKAYAMEGHLVTYNTKYGSFPEATGNINNHDALAVAGVMYDTVADGERDRYHSVGEFQALLDQAVDSVQDACTATTLKTPIDWGRMAGFNDFPTTFSRYFAYNGGLTTPGCEEIVRFYLLKEPAILTRSQMHTMRSSFKQSGSGDWQMNNFRPLQDIAERRVSSSFL